MVPLVFGAMTFDKLYDVVRLILGDRQVHGNWLYPNGTIDSSIKATFLLGRGPSGFALNDPQDQITPDFEAGGGDPYALTCYESALLLVGGEDGAMRIQTRALSIQDSGDRKRDLLSELKQRIYEIRDGGSVFASSQDFCAFLYPCGFQNWPQNWFADPLWFRGPLWCDAHSNLGA